ncbi:MAG: fibronectin type III domain-containing protein [Bdellovibrionota bacterium]
MIPAAAKEYRLYFGDTSFAAGVGGRVAVSFVTKANSISVKGLVNGTSYYFAVQAIGLDGEESDLTLTPSGDASKFACDL